MPADSKFQSGPARPAQVFKVRDLAIRWGCSSEHVVDLIDEGQLQALNIGHGARRYWRIPVEAVRQFEIVNSSLFDPADGTILPARPVGRGSRRAETSRPRKGAALP